MVIKSVFPAQAGMMPEYRTFALLMLRIPRVSRDDAFEQLKRAKAEEYSPREQG